MPSDLPGRSRSGSATSYSSLDFSVLARSSLSPRKSSLRDSRAHHRHVTAEGIDFELHGGPLTYADMPLSRHPPDLSASATHASSSKHRAADAKPKAKLRSIRRTASIEGGQPAPSISLASEAALEQLSSSLPSTSAHECYEPQRQRSVTLLERATGLPTPPRSPHSMSDTRMAQPPSPVALLSPPSSGGGRTRRIWHSPNPSDPFSSDEETFSSARVHRSRQGSLTATPSPRRRQRTISGNGSRPQTPSRLRAAPSNTLSVGAMIDGEYRELGTVNIPPVEGVTIVLRGQNGLAIESKVVHSAGETKAEVCVRSTESPPSRPVRKRVPTPSKSPLLLATPETPRLRQLSSESSPEEPVTPRRPSLETLEPLIESPTLDRVELPLFAKKSPPNRFSAAFQTALAPPSFELGGLAARRLGQDGARSMRMAVKSAFSDTESSDTTDTPSGTTIDDVFS